LRARDALVTEKGGLTVQDRRDLCAGFQLAVADVLAKKTERAIAAVADQNPSTFAVAGGVAANTVIRALLETASASAGLRFLAPPLPLCTDNAAMIAWAGIERLHAGLPNSPDFLARPRWPLDQAAPALLGSGKKGAKA
jgi:N6-L-threonylcarbamoyladenine synthase